MNYQTVHINPAAPARPEASVLAIYTGGTLGMTFDRKSRLLVPFDFEQVLDNLPELARYQFDLTVVSLDPLLDSANLEPAHWLFLARLIGEHYDAYDGFVILHGTDTMAYSASALSFLLDGLQKPVVFTGAQLPIGVARTDARSNLISALEIASARHLGQPVVPEVCIFFDHRLFRGNRARKVESGRFAAFESRNYPALAVAGVQISYRPHAIGYGWPAGPLRVGQAMDTRVATLPIFPGLSQDLLQSVLQTPGLRALALLTYGSGTAPTVPWLTEGLRHAIDRGLIVYNVSQCLGGEVVQGRYATSRHLADIGVLSGRDITHEAALTKLMYVLAQPGDAAHWAQLLSDPLRGEMRAGATTTATVGH